MVAMVIIIPLLPADAADFNTNTANHRVEIYENYVYCRLVPNSIQGIIASNYTTIMQMLFLKLPWERNQTVNIS